MFGHGHSGGRSTFTRHDDDGRQVATAGERGCDEEIGSRSNHFANVIHLASRLSFRVHVNSDKWRSDSVRAENLHR
jgi:hypothetical protein